MRVKNISARPHHVGNVSISPGEEKDIPDNFVSAINKAELIEVIQKSSGIAELDAKEVAVKKSGKSK